MGGDPPPGGGLAAIYEGSEDDFYVFRLLGGFSAPKWCFSASGDRFSASARKSGPIIFFSAPKCLFLDKSGPISVFSAPKWVL